ncbi:hypothetical protein O5623_17725 [Escherichia coli]|nr:hypothetical protein [Escherichia coli]
MDKKSRFNQNTNSRSCLHGEYSNRSWQWQNRDASKRALKASYVSGIRLYFHADSETFLAVDGDELEQESNALNKLLGHRVDTQMRIDDLTSQCTRLNRGQISERVALQTQIQQEVPAAR